MTDDELRSLRDRVKQYIADRGLENKLIRRLEIVLEDADAILAGQVVTRTPREMIERILSTDMDKLIGWRATR